MLESLMTCSDLVHEGPNLHGVGKVPNFGDIYVVFQKVISKLNNCFKTSLSE